MHEALADPLAVTLLRAEVVESAGLVPPCYHHWVDDEMHAQPVPVQLHGHAVDQEGHVVVDDLDDGVGRLPAMLLEARVVDAQLGLARSALLAEAEVGQGGTIKVERVALDQITGRHVAEEALDEAFGEPGVVAGELAANLADQLADQLRLAILRARLHCRLPSFIVGLRHERSQHIRATIRRDWAGGMGA